MDEQSATDALLEQPDFKFLAQTLRFQVLPVVGLTKTTESDKAVYSVGPRQFVGHFRLPSGRIVIVRPKIPGASVIKMIAYVYANFSGKAYIRDAFRSETVLYERDSLLFEPLVRDLNQLVSHRVQRGLYQEYIRHEENLGVLRGTVQLANHLRDNHSRPDQIFCQFHENTIDNADNQIVKWTLRRLLCSTEWSKETRAQLRSNLHQFERVSLRRPDEALLIRLHYHRLNDDYQPIHALCKFFLDRVAFSEKLGAVAFQGFLLDMNKLFEDYVTNAFLRVAQRTAVSVVSQQTGEMSDFPISFRPDVVLRCGKDVVGVVDAKYKHADDKSYRNHDFYQMLAYGTALKTSRTFLFFPTTESGFVNEGLVNLHNSQITIDIRLIDICNNNASALFEQEVSRIIANLQCGAGEVQAGTY